jgi:quercetin dioxygenase-like cupin family protein
MKLSTEEGKIIWFYQTKMVFKAHLNHTNGQYSTILMSHQPNMGPALHVHPVGTETFYVLEGSYTFTLEEKTIHVIAGDFILIPQNAAHKYKSGSIGGKMLVTTPASIETYFLHIAELLSQGSVSREYEYEFAAKHGQTFLDTSEHWGHH